MKADYEYHIDIKTRGSIVYHYIVDSIDSISILVRKVCEKEKCPESALSIIIKPRIKH